MHHRPPGSLRERNRAAKRKVFLDAARWIVAVEGEDGLTMQRLADELECGVGSIYRYYASKDHLLAAVHDEQLAEVRLAFLEHQAALGDGAGALARVIQAGRFWIDAHRTMGQHVALARRLVVAGDDQARHALLDPVAAVLDTAVAVGALAAGDGGQGGDGADGRGRAAVLVATLADVADVADDGLAAQVLGCLLVAWGADPDHLDAAPAS